MCVFVYGHVYVCVCVLVIVSSLNYHLRMSFTTKLYPQTLILFCRIITEL